ncbi:regulator [Shewanella sp. WE21]|jgi:hypothetical protein|uniref:regulator n=1 Tax=Shewanella sp. WE21 TaxID=2029986 RepID=UPI000CF6D322|nr:regulator [Shewanella sp. WE21]AVI67754.1 regulator [Shewanella sp. WE21]
MEKYKKLHQKYLHYLLVNRRLGVDEYSVITSLTEREIQIWFTPRRSKITKLMTLLGRAIIYQARKHYASDHSWLLNKQYLNQRQYLWADTLAIELVPESATSVCVQTLGLALLAEHNPRHAIIWAMRLGVSVPSSVLVVGSLVRLEVFIAQVAKDAGIELNVA